MQPILKCLAALAVAGVASVALASTAAARSSVSVNVGYSSGPVAYHGAYDYRAPYQGPRGRVFYTRGYRPGPPPVVYYAAPPPVVYYAAPPRRVVVVRTYAPPPRHHGYVCY